jgi:hypothetical protein
MAVIKSATRKNGRRILLGDNICGAAAMRVVSSDVVRTVNHVTRHNTTIHNILSTAPQLSISQKVLGTLGEDGNLMPKHVGATIHN